MGVITINLSGPKGLSTVVDEEDYRTYDLGSYNWSPLIRRSTTYAYSHNNRKTIYLHRLIMGLLDAPRSVLVDHIDHNGLNNSRTNLLVTDNSGNQRNRRKSLSAKRASSYIGAHLDRNNKTNPWRASVFLSGKHKHLGCYRTEKEAALAYNNAVIEHFGDRAYLNILPD